MPRTPRVHGNGFIQLDLTENTRLHIWGDPRIPKQTTSTPIHDHTFGFRSRILLGSLGNRKYLPNFCNEMYGGATHRLHTVEPTKKHDTELVPTNYTAKLVGSNDITWYRAGDEYTMSPTELHETLVRELTVTIMEKTTCAGGRAQVFVPLDQKPDNSFQRDDTDEELLWRIISDVMQRAFHSSGRFRDLREY